MNMIQISALPKLGKNDPVPCLRGTIAEIFKRYGEIQKLILSDETGKVGVQMVGNPEIPPDWKYKTVFITGGQWNEGTYKGQITQYVHVSGAARITLVNGQTKQAPVAPSNATAPPASPEPKTSTTTSPIQQNAPTGKNGNGNGTADKEVRSALNRLANLYLHCLEAGSYVKTNFEARNKVSMTPEQYQACVSSLYIQATRMVLDNKIQGGEFKP